MLMARSCWKSRRSDVRERTSLLLFLYQAPLLAFHPATWAPLLWPGSYFSSGNHLLKTDFRKPCCPGTAFPINQTGRNAPLFTPTPPPTPSIHYPSRLSTNIHTLDLQWKHAHANTNISISTHLPPHLVCSRCHCRCPWAGSRCRSPGSECCCYSRDYTARGGNWEKKKKKRLRLGCSNLPWQLLYKREEIFQQLMAGLVISRCTRLGSKMVIALSVLKVRDIMRVTEVR